MYKGFELVRTFKVYNIVDGVTVPYDLTSKTVVLDVYSQATVPVLLFSITPSAKGLGFCTCTFTKVNTDQLLPCDYYIVEDKVGINKLLIYGLATPVNVQKFIAFSEMVANESVEGLVIPESFIETKSYEWRLFLQNALTEKILDADIANEAAWPTLANFLIAKLVVYSFIMNLIRNSPATSLSSSSEAVTANVKKIETGPSNTEFYDTGANIADMMKPNAQGKSAFDALKSELCNIAGKLRVSIPDICGYLPESPVIPIKVGRPDQIDVIDYLAETFPE